MQEKSEEPFSWGWKRAIQTDWKHALADVRSRNQGPGEIDLAVLVPLVRFQKHVGIVAYFTNNAMG